MQQLRNVIVTGSNKGIGFAIAEYLAGKGDWNVIMAVRNIELGEASKKEILAKHPNAHVHLEKLDISDPQSITAFIPTIQNKYQHIDVLVNNAGVATKGDTFDSEVIKFTFTTNFYGTIQLSEAILPVLSKNGKIVSLGSSAGKMSFNKITNEDLKNRFTNPNITRDELFGLVHEFEQAVADSTYAAKGWPKWGYGISKLSINIYHKILAQHEVVKQNGIQVYVCCPGYVKTDMTSHQGHLSLEEGIRTPIYLIELPFEQKEELQGGFFYLEKLTSTFA